MWPAGASTSHSSSRMSLDIWRSMHAIAPEACHAVAAAANAATASGYFRMESANGNAVADRYEQLSWAAVLAGAAIGRGKATAYLQNPARYAHRLALCARPLMVMPQSPVAREQAAGQDHARRLQAPAAAASRRRGCRRSQVSKPAREARPATSPRRNRCRSARACASFLGSGQPSACFPREAAPAALFPFLMK